MAKIGLMTSLDISVRNMEQETYRIASLLSERHEVHLIGTNTASSRISETFRIFPAQRKKFRPLSWRKAQLRDYIRAEQPDVLMTLSSIGVNGLAVAQTAKQAGIPSIVRLTSDVFNVWKTKETLTGRLSLFLRNNILGRRAMSLANRVVVLHDVQRDNLKLPAEKIYVAPQPVTFPDAAPHPLHRPLNIPKTAYVVGSMMRLDHNKRLDLLAKTITRCLDADPNVYFLILGGGNGKNWLMRNIPQNTRIIFTGEVSPETLPRYYATCDAVVHMSDSEGLSNVILEALYFRKPVLATNSGAITRALVSNIYDDAEGFTRAIVTRSATLDPLPEQTDQRWLELIDEVLSPKSHNHSPTPPQAVPAPAP